MVCHKSTLFRSPELTIKDIIEDFPDHLQDFARQVVDKMIGGYFLMEKSDNDDIVTREEQKKYVINPNKIADIKRVLFK